MFDDPSKCSVGWRSSQQVDPEILTQIRAETLRSAVLRSATPVRESVEITKKGVEVIIDVDNINDESVLDVFQAVYAACEALENHYGIVYAGDHTSEDDLPFHVVTTVNNHISQLLTV